MTTRPAARRDNFEITLAKCGVLAMALCMILACATTPRSTRIQLDDFNAAAAKMAQSLASSRFLAERRPDSPRIIVTVNKIENLTDDIITPAEQWMFIERVRTTLPIETLRKQKNITFQIPVEQQRMLARDGFDVDPFAGPKPTHVMKAVFLSAPRMVRNDDDNINRRQDFYYMEYTITDLNTRQLVWSDTFEFKREAVGLLID